MDLGGAGFIVFPYQIGIFSIHLLTSNEMPSLKMKTHRLIQWWFKKLLFLVLLFSVTYLTR